MGRDENAETIPFYLIPIGDKYPNVEISVCNFGPIEAVDIDLRPLTIFVGPSNTGKTYLSVLLYALHCILSGFPRFPFSNDSAPHQLLLDSELFVGSELFEKPIIRSEPFKFSDLPDRACKAVQDSLKDQETFITKLQTELERCFDLESTLELIRSQSNEMMVSMQVTEENQDLWHFNLRTSESGIIGNGSVNENMILFRVPSFVERIKGLLEGRRSIGKAYYLPAARSGIMQSHRVIASSLIARSTRAGLETLDVPTLSGVVADFMEQLILYEEDARPDDGMNRIVDALESDVLNGQIIMKPSPTGYPEFLYRPQGTEQDIRLTRSSSMVSELAPLVLFLRGVISPGDTLIIEEPEAHLHPAAQAQMAATLARLVRAGVRVLVTTHSDFMLQEIGNLMRVGMLKEKDALKTETNDWLLPDEVGAWHFQKDQPVKEIQFDHTVGIEPEDYEDVVESLYNRWAGLQNRIEELKDESERECE